MNEKIPSANVSVLGFLEEYRAVHRLCLPGADVSSLAVSSAAEMGDDLKNARAKGNFVTVS